ncbi:membrane protein [Verrucomicrobiota bacterium]|nr:membrane protein [Verrucomicrobiota bacterium]
MKNTVSLTVLAGVCLPLPALALGLRVADQDAAATARGNAFAATADNPSALYYNPAGISQLDGTQARANFYGIGLESTYTAPGPGGAQTKTKYKLHGIPDFYFTTALKSAPVTFGVGVFAPYGLGVEWPDSTAPFRATKGEMAYYSFTPVVSWKLHKTFSFAAGPTINYANTEFQQTVFPRGFPPPPFPALYQTRLRGEGTDVGFVAGAQWKPTAKHAFGLSYRSATAINFQGSLDAPDPTLTSRVSMPADARIKFPQHLIAGWSYRPTPAWNLEVNVDWTDWSRLKQVDVRSGGSTVSTLPFNWKNSFFYEFGVTRYFDKSWHASAGYIYSENSVPDATLNPIVPDSDRHIFSIGGGRNYQKWRWDLAYQLAYGPARTVTGNTYTLADTAGPGTGIPASANGTFEFLSHALALSVGYKF